MESVLASWVLAKETEMGTRNKVERVGRWSGGQKVVFEYVELRCLLDTLVEMSSKLLEM